MAVKALQHDALQKEFIQNHLQPLAIDFAIVKGTPLAERYYPHPHTRISRDIDIWLSAKDMVKVVRSAQAAGFLVYPYQRRLNPTAIAIHFKTRQDIILVDSRSILVELDQRLDKSGQFFCIDKVLPRCEYQTINDVTIKVLPTTELFIYLCLHHTRHRWSKMIWLADIEALQCAPDYDPAAIEATARSMGVWQTVEATLLFAAACRSTDPRTAARQDDRVLDMLQDCHAIFLGGRAQEVAAYHTRLTPDFPYAWQINDDQAQRNDRHKYLKRFIPTLNDYHMVPLPLSLYPLYYLLRPALALVRKWQRARNAKSTTNHHPRSTGGASAKSPAPLARLWQN